MPTYHIVCHDCEFERIEDERYVAAAERDTHADDTEHYEGEPHDVEYERIDDGG